MPYANSSPSTKILIVDDELSFRQMLSTLLEDAGYRAFSAANGRDALTYLRQSRTKPGLILLDMAMPVMSGWDFLRVQRHEARLSSIPVVIVTARGLSEEERNEAHAVA